MLWNFSLLTFPNVRLESYRLQFSSEAINHRHGEQTVSFPVALLKIHATPPSLPFSITLWRKAVRNSSNLSSPVFKGPLCRSSPPWRVMPQNWRQAFSCCLTAAEWGGRITSFSCGHYSCLCQIFLSKWFFTKAWWCWHVFQLVIWYSTNPFPSNLVSPNLGSKTLVVSLESGLFYFQGTCIIFQATGITAKQIMWVFPPYWISSYFSLRVLLQFVKIILIYNPVLQNVWSPSQPGACQRSLQTITPGDFWTQLLNVDFMLSCITLGQFLKVSHLSRLRGFKNVKKGESLFTASLQKETNLGKQTVVIQSSSGWTVFPATHPSVKKQASCFALWAPVWLPHSSVKDVILELSFWIQA